MLAVAFEGSRPIAKPANMTDEQCSSLEIFQGIDLNKLPFFLSCWKPSKEDIDAINAGRPVWLKIVSLGHPPVSLFTLDENGDGNF